MVVRYGEGYLVRNNHKDFISGHSHLNSFNACKTAIDLVIGKKKPRSKNLYFLITLQRLSNNEKYIQRIETIKKKIYLENAKKKKNLEKGDSNYVRYYSGDQSVHQSQ